MNNFTFIATFKEPKVALQRDIYQKIILLEETDYDGY